MDLVELRQMRKDWKEASKSLSKMRTKLESIKISHSKWEVERAEKELYSTEEEVSCLERGLTNSWKG